MRLVPRLLHCVTLLLFLDWIKISCKKEQVTTHAFQPHAHGKSTYVYGWPMDGLGESLDEQRTIPSESHRDILHARW